MDMLRNAIWFLAAGVCFGMVSPQDSRVDKELERLHIPETLVPKGKHALFMLRGEGVQIYGAEEVKGGLEWVLRAPEAKLLDYQTGAAVGTHSLGPTWVDADGGKLTGKKLMDAPAPNASAVPWLLLEVKSDSRGRFANVTHVQRVDTWGGKAPAIKPAKAGDVAEVRYEATYVFFGS
jgi:hypothetical protein